MCQEDMVEETMEATAMEDTGIRQRASRRALPTQRHRQVPASMPDHRAIHIAARPRNPTQLGLLPLTHTLRLVILHIRTPRLTAPRHTHTLRPDMFHLSHIRQGA